MDAEQAIGVLGAVLPKKVSVSEADALLPEGLTDIQVIVFRQCWEGRSYSEMAAQIGYNRDYVKQVGSQLWRLLSDKLDQKVSKANVQSVLRRYHQEQQEAIAVPNPPQKDPGQVAAKLTQDWGEFIDVSVFYGRTEELAILERWILEDKCRLVALLGMGGIGKTALLAKLSKYIQQEFNYVVWRSLCPAPPLTDLLAEVIRFLSGQQNVHLPETVEGQISCLIRYLRSSRCLLMLDDAWLFESGERAGCYRFGYEEYGQLFKRVADERHQSCLVLTSREQPREFAGREGNTSPVRLLQLEGLRLAQGQYILKDEGLVASSAEFHVLVEAYAGNPLMLRLVEATIRSLFGGNVSEFLAQNTFVFGEIWELLDQQLSRLSALEQQVMHRLAVDCEGVTLCKLRGDLVPASCGELIDALASLQRRSLIETRSGHFSQQPIVREYMSERLIKQFSEETVI